MAEKLTALEAALVDVHRESDRDVLRNPAGLNDTLLGLISTVSLSDSAPTNQAAAVSREIMARVDAEIGKLERLAATEVATVNRLALGQEVEEASGYSCRESSQESWRGPSLTSLATRSRMDSA